MKRETINMKHWLINSVLICVIYLSNKAVASGASHWYTIDLFQHLLWNQTCVKNTAIPVPSANTKTTAYFLEGKERCLEVDPEFMHSTVKQMIQNAGELTILTAVKQQPQNTGSIMSFYSNSQRFFELESSGRKNELRLHYIHKQRAVSEIFPHQLADNQWHTVALSFTDSFLQLFVDCEKVFERRIPTMDFSFLQRDNIELWLGQRNTKHGYFKGSIGYVKLLNSPDGYLSQCPYADVACPSCSEYTSLKETVTELYSMVQSLHSKLETQEERLGQLEECECRHHCEVDGIKYRDGESWEKEKCTTCTCREGKVQCSQPKCSPVSCKNPVLLDGECCPVCLRHCYHNGRFYDHGESFTSSGRVCVRCKCEDGQLACQNAEMQCPVLTCPKQEQMSVEGQCCKVCADSVGRFVPDEIDYCQLGHNCHPNATCVNLSNRYTCKCKDGFLGNEEYCRDTDECLEEGGERGHHCSSHSRCINTLGSYTCECDKGYIKLDPYTCREHNECDTGAHTCAAKAECENSEGGYACHCMPGYAGDGFSCTPMCEGGCENGGECISPGTCQCRKGFYGRQCQIDIDECRLGIARCHPNSVCINIPGDYLCECLPGYQSLKGDNRNGWLCKDLDECAGYGGGHKCSHGTVCENTEGSYQCVCSKPSDCRADCYVNGAPMTHGSRWPSVDDVCSDCRCNNGRVECHPRACHCGSVGVDFRCCPQCKPENKCPHQELSVFYHSGDTWTYQCQTCQCINGETDCSRLECPTLTCSPTVRLPGDCCPRCSQETDPCLAANNSPAILDVTKGRCEFGGKVYRPEEEWRVASVDMCTKCACKNGHVCCSHNTSCLQDPRYARRHLRHQPSMSDYSYDDPVEIKPDENNDNDITQNILKSNNKGQQNFPADSNNNNNVHDTGQNKGISGRDEDKNPQVDLQTRGQQGLSRNVHLNNHGSRGSNRRKDSRRRSNHRRYRGAGSNRGWRSNEDLTYSLRGQG